MSWAALLALAAAIYAQKALGPVLLGDRRLPAGADRLLALIAVPLLAALVVVQTVSDEDRLAVDARLPALAVAAVCVWRRTPFLVTVVAAAAAAAGVRAIS